MVIPYRLIGIFGILFLFNNLALASSITFFNTTYDPINITVYGLSCSTHSGKCYVNRNDASHIKLKARGRATARIRGRCLGAIQWSSTLYRQGYMAPYMHQRGVGFAAIGVIKIRAIRGYRGIDTLMLSNDFARNRSNDLIPCRTRGPRY